MSREIRFRYVYQHYETGRIATVFMTMEQLESGTLAEECDYEWRRLYGRISRDQFTGLHDRNGTPIYEGDVVVVPDTYLWFDDGKPNYRGTVEWVFSQWQVIAHCINPERRGISDGINEGLNDDGVEDGDKSLWEVIGNIHENPDLLETPEGGQE